MCLSSDTALAQHGQLLRYKAPHQRDLNIFSQWLKHYTKFWTVDEIMQWYGSEEKVKDLITLAGRYENVDLLTRWMYRVFIPFWHKHGSTWYRRLTGSEKVGGSSLRLNMR